MTNHPNRGKRTPAARPSPATIAHARIEARLDPPDAAALVYATTTQWLAWESGARPMHPGLLKLFKAVSAALRRRDGLAIQELLDGLPDEETTAQTVGTPQ